MSIIVFAELEGGKIKKASQEAASYAGALGKQSGKDVIAVALGPADASELAGLGAYGVNKVMHCADDSLSNLDARNYTRAIASAATESGAEWVVFSHNYAGKAVAARVAARLSAGLVAGVTALPSAEGQVTKGCFSGKGFGTYSYSTACKVIALAPNSFGIKEGTGTAEVASFSPDLTAPSVKVVSTNKLSDSIPLSEADNVVSGGRGLRGPENWDMIEELANLLGAATACSRAVSDVDWRPHHEHVGQTGLAISPNLYIAVAISGAIQHLAGVSSSKTIVVINKDPEAPFFKAADYGIVGDAFEVVPKMIEILKRA
ncbi:electron transfer flavoprotein subunit alpha/FixB family protein [Chitinophagales bacterium]|nr:electron transfer flavoprotein subunit alpha/FixB family protein [Chitinophagales bacterium]